MGEYAIGLPRGKFAGVLCGLLALACSFALAAPARAIYGPMAGGFGAELVSVDNASDEQGNAPTTDAEVSANGQYVVFQTEATNFFEDDGETTQEKEAAEPPGTLREGGIFRYDRETGRLELVASGNLVVDEGKEAGKILVRGAQNPSVSADGRYIAFTSAQQFAPHPQPKKTENVEVYERDMDRAPSETGAYTLVSAENGSEEAPKYEDSSITPPIPGGDPGTQLWPNTAISANGRYVLFRTTEVPSSLPDNSVPDMPPNQLFVRDLQAKTTTLVTRTLGGEAAGGAEGPATISADGSTVAWVGTNAPEQSTFLPGESLDEATPYYLWRRWQEDGATTRRVTGITDPEDPECPVDERVTQSPTAEGPCYGPLSFPESALSSISAEAPALSADGYTVAFLAGSELRPDVTKPDALDLFLTSMQPGVTRKAGTSELTLAVKQAQGNSSASITSVALSPDGSHIAFVSQRNDFVLPDPAPLGSFSQNAQQSELYVIDLSTNTLERAVLGVGGGEPNGSTIGVPTLTADGSTIAFVSSASNLVDGDANGFPDAFTTSVESPGGTAAPPAEVNAAQSGFSLTGSTSPELGLIVKRAANGNLIVLVETPGAGKLTVRAVGTITAKTGRSRRKRKVVLARASGSIHAEGTATLILRLASNYAKDLKQVGKLKTLITVTYSPAHPGEALSSEASATFLAAGTKKARGASKAQGHGKKG
jgi:Tol biopolymer transport system component